MRFLLGAYGPDMGGFADGVGMLHAGVADDHLAGGSLTSRGVVFGADSPSWIARHPSGDVFYAALEKRGVVQGFRRTGEETFAALGAPLPAGEATCHVSVTSDGRGLMASNWADGRVIWAQLDDAGVPSRPQTLPTARDPYGPDADVPESSSPDLDLAAARALRDAAGAEYAHLVPHAKEPETAEDAAESARPSRAHQTIEVARGLYASADMGLDLVRFWRVSSGAPRVAQEVVLPRGTGPRHMALHPSGHLYVVTELSREVYVLAWRTDTGAGAWRVVSAASLGPTFADDTAAEIALSHVGDFVQVGVRGSNTIATLRVRGAGDSLDPVALVEAGVDWPRHHRIERDTLLVAGQRSNAVVSLALDERTGVPGRVRHRVETPSPTCIQSLA
ncbi:lactonase family protein [Microbacterium koreense]|uniref:Lactonase family protein n=1 Tax=Microbacterium koreense TaxID=323761 RepID=A0ABW2ZNN0_9MICO